MAVLTLLLGCATSLTAADRHAPTLDLVGTWELVRVDGLKPRDVPPGDYFPKLIVELGEGGRMKYWTVGEQGKPSEGTYSIRKGKFDGWLGLSNDLDTPRPLTVPSDGWMELSYPDGFVATFHRIASPQDVHSGCAFFTVAGYDYDAQQVARLKEATFHFRPEPVPPRLIGKWQAVRGSADQGSVELDLTLRADSAHLVVRSIDPPTGTLLDAEGSLEVSGEYLRSSALACGAIHHLSLDGGVLELVNSAEPPIRLGPVQ